MYRAPGDRATEMMDATGAHATVATGGGVGGNARLTAERYDTFAQVGDA